MNNKDWFVYSCYECIYKGNKWYTSGKTCYESTSYYGVATTAEECYEQGNYPSYSIDYEYVEDGRYFNAAER